MSSEPAPTTPVPPSAARRAHRPHGLLRSVTQLVVVTGVLAGVSACSAGVTDTGSPAAATSASSPTPTGSSGTSGGTSGTSTAPPGQTSVTVPSVSVPPVGTGTAGGSGGSGTSAPGGGAALPDGFPLPPGATVEGVVRDGNEIDGRVSIGDGEQAFGFWQQALPGAGYTVTDAQSAAGFGEIRFAGHGCGGDSQIAITGTSAAVQCDLG